MESGKNNYTSEESFLVKDSVKIYSNTTIQYVARCNLMILKMNAVRSCETVVSTYYHYLLHEEESFLRS